jgi:hypothetical protein
MAPVSFTCTEVSLPHGLRMAYAMRPPLSTLRRSTTKSGRREQARAARFERQGRFANLEPAACEQLETAIASSKRLERRVRIWANTVSLVRV